MSYTADATEFLKSRLRSMKEGRLAFATALVEHLKCCEIFKLPHGALILPRHERGPKEMMQAFSVPVRSPYGCVAMEFTQDVAEGRDKMITICADMKDDGPIQSLLKACGAEYTGVFMTSLICVGDVWGVGKYGVFFQENYNRSIFKTDFSGLTDDDVEPALENSNSPLGAFAMLTTALSCTNVRIETTEPPAKLNAKRARNKREQIRKHHTLVVQPGKVTGSGQATGAHASPRVHLRRGHIRRLESKNTWVNACVVGDKSRGILTKDYDVRRSHIDSPMEFRRGAL